jgi:chromosome partitioning protein
MAVIAVYSLKGGVGKTSFAVNLAWASAKIARRATLLWDLDPQWAASFLVGHEPEERAMARAVLSESVRPKERLLWTGIDNLDLMPADASLRGIDSYFATLGKRRRILKLAEELTKTYDRIILDCPPGLTETSDQMMLAADLIIVPVIPSPLSKRALDEVQNHLLTVHGGHVPILPVYSMVDRRRKMHIEAMKANPRWPVIPMTSAVEQMGARQTPIGEYARNNPAAQAFGDLWKGIERKLSRAK